MPESLASWLTESPISSRSSWIPWPILATSAISISHLSKDRQHPTSHFITASIGELPGTHLDTPRNGWQAQLFQARHLQHRFASQRPVERPTVPRRLVSRHVARCPVSAAPGRNDPQSLLDGRIVL